MPDFLAEIAAGSLAAGFTACLFNPLEVVKTRLQVQAEVAAATGAPLQYEGFRHALRRIAAEDGLLRFWQHGFVGFVGRDLLYSGIRIGMYPSVRGLYAGGLPQEEIPLLSKIAAGVTTGAVGSALANPLDVLRVRTSSEGGLICPKTGLYTTGLYVGRPPSYRNSAHALWTILQTEGLARGLWRGTSATMARAAALSGGQLASYDHGKVMIKGAGLMEEGTRLHVVAAIISGIVATTCCNPPDVVKSRLMLERAAARGVASAGPLAIAGAIWREQGLRGFFRGWLPAYARAGPAYFIQMPIVEQLRSSFGLGSL